MPFLKMVKFQLKLYIKNSYFVNLVIIETSSMLLYEYLAGYVGHNYSGQEWLIAGIM
ncbi:MAG TPA: multidrug ABC transporter permease, partial [Lactobacillus acetotolerans]|nr:multidrug ABC transporter permease [Lactobacillus acetotolerans]